MPGFRRALGKLFDKGSRNKSDSSGKNKETRFEKASDEGQSKRVSVYDCSQSAKKEEIPTASHPNTVGTTVDNRDNELRTTIHNDFWRDAYANLKKEKEKAKYIDYYEELLSAVFLKDAPVQSSSRAGGNEGDPDISVVSSDEMKMRLIIEKGLEKVKTSRIIIEGSITIEKAIAPVRAVLDIPLKNIAQTALPWAIVTSSLDLLMKPAKSMTALYDGVVAVNARIEWYSKMTDMLLSPGNNNVPLEQVRNHLGGQILKLYQSLLFYQIKSVCFYYRNQFVGILRSFFDLDDWDGDLSAVTESETKLHQDLDQYKSEQMRNELGQILNEVRQLTMAQDERAKLGEDKQCMKDLFKIDPRSEIRKIQKARGEPVKEIYDWILKTDEFKRFIDWEDPESPNIMHVSGQAGTGKTMLSVGLVQELLGSGILDMNRPEVIYFFIKDIGEEFNDSAAILRSLMWLLLVQNQALIRHLRSRYDQSGDALFKNTQSFTDLLPIFKAMLQDDDMGRVIVILDALDECKGPSNECGGLGKDIFDLMEEMLPTDKTASKIKILATSRSLYEIDTMMERICPNSRVTIKLDEHSLSGPINLYIDLQRPGLISRAKSENDANKAIQELKKNAGRTFIWVYLVCEQLMQLPLGQWKQTLEYAPRELENLYGFLLDRLNTPGQDRWYGYCKKVLLFVMLACRPLNLSELEAFIEPPREIDLATLIQDCRSFLTVQQNTVYPIHKSATDYLRSNHEVLGKAPFEELHHEVFKQALHSMKNNLKWNMYNLVNHGVSIEEAHTPKSSSLHPVRYFCQYWIHHLKESGLQGSDTSILLDFFHAHLLHWLEALSLLHIVPVAMETIIDLQLLIPQDEGGDLSQFLFDVKRFLAQFSPIIAEAPLQTYVCTLVFAPEKSKVREIFQHEKPRWVSRVRPSETTWSPSLRSLEDKGYNGGFVAVSPKSDIMVTSWSNSVDVVNLATGTLVRSLPVQDLHGGMAFSSCGGLLAAGTNDGTVQIWDTSKWKETKSLDHPGEVKLICAFSPHGGLLATASRTRVTLWDLATWSVQWSIPSPNSFLPFVAFSCDGHVVSGYKNKAHFYNWKSGDLVKAIETRPAGEDSTDDAVSVSFSSNGLWVALCSMSGFRVLNLSSMIDELVGLGSLSRVAFSPNSLLLATAETYAPIKLWNTQTWTLVQTFEPHSFVSDLAFSANCQVLVSAAHGQVTRLWDLTLHSLRDGQEEIPHIHSKRVENIAYSPTGEHVASVDDDKLAVWDPKSGGMIYTRNIGSWVKNLLFSPDGKQIVTYLAIRQKVIVWNVRSGEQEREISLGAFSDITHHFYFQKVPNEDNWEYVSYQGEFPHSVPFRIETPLPPVPQNVISYDWNEGWIMSADYTERLLWVPPENRPDTASSYEIYGHIFASGSFSGRVSFLTFQLDSPVGEAY